MRAGASDDRSENFRRARRAHQGADGALHAIRQRARRCPVRRRPSRLRAAGRRRHRLRRAYLGERRGLRHRLRQHGSEARRAEEGDRRSHRADPPRYRSECQLWAHEVFDSPLWQKSDVVGRLKSMAREQLGTVGTGNHYVDLFEDEEGFVWIGVHFGSRGLGHKTATGFLKLAGGKEGIDVAPTLLHQDSDLGRQYLAGMALAGQYAYAGREWVIERVRSIIGGEVLDTVHNHHNYAWRERHGDRELWVVRKGATPAFPGQRGFVGGSMGDDAVILTGVESAASAASLYSTVHGAGRIMSRTEARGRFVKDPATGKRIRQLGRVRHDEMQAWLRGKGVRLVGGGLDEAPQAYRRLPDVLAHHTGTVKIEHTLRPFAVLMAGADMFDPFKD